jgi:GDP-L-fucose synthase
VGCGEDVSIGELAEMIRRVVGYEGALDFDPSKPDGTPLRRLDVSRLFATGWKPAIRLEDGIRTTYRWFCDNRGHLRDGSSS